MPASPLISPAKLVRMTRLAGGQLLNQVLQPVSRSSGRILNAPTSIFLEITSECFMRCHMCDMWKNEDAAEALSTQEKRELIKELHEWLGPLRISFTGGEPLMKREELTTLARFCTEQGILCSTNTAALTLTDGVADELESSGLTELLISLDSLTRETHDAIRGRAGTFDRVQHAIAYLNRRPRRMRLAVRTLIHRYNLHELVPMVRWTKEVGLDGIGFHPLESRSVFGEYEAFDPAWFGHDDYWPPDPQAVAGALDELIQLKRQGDPIDTAVDHLQQIKQYYADPSSIGLERNCYTGVKNLIIGSNGDVRLCFIMPPIGNVRARRVRDLWRSQEAAERRVLIKECTQNCSVIACNRRYALHAQVKPFLQRMLS